MGVYTWTYVGEKNRAVPYGKISAYVLFPKEFGGVNRHVTYNDGYGCLSCSECYEEYGSLCGGEYTITVDELAALWNRPYLKPFIEKCRAEGDEYSAGLMEAFMESNEAAAAYVAAHVDLNKYSYYATDWLREIGITISCDDERHKLLKYPIRISEFDEPYENFRSFSYSTQ